MADKPSRALVLYGEGIADSPLPSARALHSFAARSACGFLALRSCPSEAEDDRATWEFAQLIDACDLYNARTGAFPAEVEPSTSKISDRFMGLKAALFTGSSGIESVARDYGVTCFQLKDLAMQSGCVEPSSRLLSLLGFSNGSVQETSDFDIVIVHVSSQKTDVKAGNSGGNAVDWLDKLVGGIMKSVQPGTAIASRLHLSVILSFGSVYENVDQLSLATNYSAQENSDLSLLRPSQSYCRKDGKLLNDVRHHHPMLVAQWQEGVTRRDLAEEFSFEEIFKKGGNLAILAERFLHEVAFKMWKALKYGA